MGITKWLLAVLFSVWAGTALAALALDGTGTNQASCSSCTVSLTTSSNNDVVCVAAQSNGGPITGVSSANVSGWAKRVGANQSGNTSFPVEIWCGTAALALTGETITVTTTSSSFFFGAAWGISGAATSNFVNASNSQTTAATDVTITTTNANAFIVAAYRMQSTGAPTVGTNVAWQGIVSGFGGSFTLVEYIIVSSTQTNLDAQLTTGAGDQGAGAAIAICASPSCGSGNFRTLMGVGQ